MGRGGGLRPETAAPPGRSSDDRLDIAAYTIQNDRTKRLLDVEALIRIVTTPQLLP